jgi:SAM-dependent methyltransferase
MSVDTPAAEAGLDQILTDLYTRAPMLFALLDPERIRRAPPMSQRLPVDFEPSAVGGRGDTYRSAQADASVRLVGISQLVEMALGPPNTTTRSTAPIVLDVLGGDGTIARAVRMAYPSSPATVLTSDLSRSMVLAAQLYGLPALSQPAQSLLLRDEVVDGVILAYGTHHIPPAERLLAVKEAYRVTIPGGRIVVHDFAKRSAVAQWFTHVVDRYSITGHRFSHFTRHEMRRLLQCAGYHEIEVRSMYDPFIVNDNSSEEALATLGAHLVDMYGLDKLRRTGGRAAAVRRAIVLAQRYFRYDSSPAAPGQTYRELTCSARDGRYWAELPRVALVATGRRPS